MKTKIDLETWSRKHHFAFFNAFDEPLFGATVNIDVTVAYQTAKQRGISFFLYYLHCILTAANQVKEFKYRVEDGDVYLYDVVNTSTTISRPDTTFGFSYIDHQPDLDQFIIGAQAEIKRVKSTVGLELRPVYNVLHVSAIPWVNFTALTHARNFAFKDSMPKISLGKITELNGKKTMPVSVTVHHGLMDGRHVGEFIDTFQELLNRQYQVRR